jgi:hypothetical protein
MGSLHAGSHGIPSKALQMLKSTNSQAKLNNFTPKVYFKIANEYNKIGEDK